MKAPGEPVFLILKRDHLVAELLGAAIRRRVPDAVIHLAFHVEDALRKAAAGVDLLVTGISLSDQDTLEALAPQSALRRLCRAVLVVTSRGESRIVEAVQALGVDGFLPTLASGLAEFEQALDRVCAGGVYWPKASGRPARTVLRGLAPAEERILSCIGDGSDDETAAQLLGLRASYIQTVRRNIHKKCGLRHKGDLVKFALQHGFVRVTPTGIVRLLPARAAPVGPALGGEANGSPPVRRWVKNDPTPHAVLQAVPRRCIP